MQSQFLRNNNKTWDSHKNGSYNLVINCFPIEIQGPIMRTVQTSERKGSEGKGEKKEEEREKSEEKEKTIVPSVALTSNSRTQEMEADSRPILLYIESNLGYMKKKKIF